MRLRQCRRTRRDERRREWRQRRAWHRGQRGGPYDGRRRRRELRSAKHVGSTVLPPLHLSAAACMGRLVAEVEGSEVPPSATAAVALMPV